MKYEQMLAGEALKRFYDGRFVEVFNVGCFHLWDDINRSGCGRYDGSSNPLNIPWQVDELGALFLMHMKFSGHIEVDDCKGNWWTNELVEDTLKGLEFFKAYSLFMPRLKMIYRYSDGTYTLDMDDTLFKNRCKTKTRFLLQQFLTTGHHNTDNWESVGLI